MRAYNKHNFRLFHSSHQVKSAMFEKSKCDAVDLKDTHAAIVDNLLRNVYQI